jgi:hypothetical protein
LAGPQSHETRIWAELAEIDENLIRRDLSRAERADLMARRKAIYVAMRPETVSVRVRGGPGRGKENQSKVRTGLSDAFIDNTAKTTGRSRSSIAQDVARGDAIAGKAAKLRGTCAGVGAQVVPTVAWRPLRLEHRVELILRRRKPSRFAGRGPRKCTN